MEILRAVVRCVMAVAECVSVVCHSMAKILDVWVQALEKYGREPGPTQQRNEQQRVEEMSMKQTSERETEEIPRSTSVKDDAGREPVQQPSMEFLNVPGRFYAVVKGTKVGLFQSWFAAGSQVLNVPGSMQERFSTRLEALQFMTSFFQTIGWNEDIIEYDEQAREMYRYRQSDLRLRRET